MSRRNWVRYLVLGLPSLARYGNSTEQRRTDRGILQGNGFAVIIPLDYGHWRSIMRGLRHFIIAASDYATRSIIRRTVFNTCTAITVSAVETSRAALAAHKCVGADIVIVHGDLPQDTSIELV